MKRMKKVISLLLTLLLTSAMTATVFAAGETGSITINGVSADTTYEIYKMLDLESYSTEGRGAYSYTINPAWVGFFVDNPDPDVDDAMNYVTIEKGYVLWKEGVAESAAAEFAKLALAYAQGDDPENPRIQPVKSSETVGDFAITGTTGVFSNLDLGYYLVDSTAGALCGLTTTNPDASINAKNHTPTIDKQVQEDLTGMWGDVNTADIGQIVNYMSIVHAAAGAQNYVMHDKMADGLTFLHEPIPDPADPTDIPRGVTQVKHVNSLGVEAILTEGTDYTVVHTDADLCDADECTFEVAFSDTFVATLKPNDRLLVYYNAMLNRHAVIAGEGNENESWLEYGEDHFTTEDATKTYTFSIDIVKTDSQNTLIDGAKFKIYDAATGGNEIAVVPLMNADDSAPVLDDNDNPVYRRARADETGVEIEVLDGHVTVVGFDNGIYYLEETFAPEGYNKLTARQEFTISDANLDSVFNGTIYSSGSGVHVVNKTGSMLPETGGMGTVMFITFGTIVALGTGVLLVTKKRMSMIQD